MKITPEILVGSMVSVAFLLPAPTAMAAAKEARVTQIIREVKLLPSEGNERPAAVNDKVSEDTGVKTGGDSRSELTFPDMTITRLGSNTIFSFSKAGRTAKVDSGSILLRVPKDSGGGTIRNNAVTVAVTGTTVIFEGTRGTKSKLITLEGSARFSLRSKPDEFRNVLAGQMLDVPSGATTLPMPVNVNLNDVMRKHPLITDFKPLPSQPLIMAAAQQPPPRPRLPGPAAQTSASISLAVDLIPVRGPTARAQPPEPTDHHSTGKDSDTRRDRHLPNRSDSELPKSSPAVRRSRHPTGRERYRADQAVCCAAPPPPPPRPDRPAENFLRDSRRGNDHPPPPPRANVIERKPVVFSRGPEEKKQESQPRNDVAAKVEEWFAQKMAKGHDHKNEPERDESVSNAQAEDEQRAGQQARPLEW